VFLAQAAEQSTNWISQYQGLFTGFGFGGLMLILFLTDKIKTVTSYNEMKEDRNLWREKALEEQQRADKTSAQLDVALEQGKITAHFWESLDTLAKRNSRARPK